MSLCSNKHTVYIAMYTSLRMVEVHQPHLVALDYKGASTQNMPTDSTERGGTEVK